MGKEFIAFDIVNFLYQVSEQYILFIGTMDYILEYIYEEVFNYFLKHPIIIVPRF